MPAFDENLKTIRFEGELLPDWALLLDVAARLCPVSEETRDWFSRLTNSSGVDDARTVISHAGVLDRALRKHRESIIVQLERTRGDGQAVRIFAAWSYSLETMIQTAAARKTCSWTIDGCDDSDGDDGGGEITLRRV